MSKLARVERDEIAALRTEVRQQVTLLGGLVVPMWALEVVDFVLGGALDRFGVRPRSMGGLLGILFAPFLHVGFAHLVANTVPLLVLGFLIMQRRKRELVYVTIASALVGGLGIWLVGASRSVHLGASILVFGYLGYLLARGFFERSWKAILLSGTVFVVYGGALFGVLPTTPGVSWEGHLFGLVGGVLAARWLAREHAARTG